MLLKLILSECICFIFYTAFVYVNLLITIIPVWCDSCICNGNRSNKLVKKPELMFLFFDLEYFVERKVPELKLRIPLEAQTGKLRLN